MRHRRWWTHLPWETLRLFRKSRSDDKHMELGGMYLTVFWANELGDFEEARTTLETYRYLFAAFPDSWTQAVSSCWMP